MFGKLKENKGYYLIVEDVEIAIFDNERTERPLYSLSENNCETIKRGYDIELLSIEYASHFKDDNGTSDVDFMMGFLKAIEIKSDKNFSEEDVRKAIDIAWRNEESNKIDIIQSIKKTEWDVKIEMECPQCKEWGYLSECRNECNKNFLQPKLDKNNCLILKRI